MLPRRTLDELHARYELEPSTRDVFVEGEFDRRAVTGVLRALDVTAEVSVFEINSVDVPSELAKARGYPANNRGRLCVLGLELTSRLGPGSRQATCIVDRDFAEYLGETPPCELVLFTDYVSMEMYFFDEEAVDRVLLATGSTGVRADHVMTAVGAVIERSFCFRLAALRLEWAAFSRLELTRCCTLDGHDILFDEDDYVQRLLSKNSRLADRPAFQEAVRELEPGLDGDPKLRQDGHDLTEVMAWYLRGLGHRPASSDAVVVFLLTAADWPRLLGEPLFEALARRL